MKTIAIIPARGGSKGVPGKNIRMFAGKPLIVHSIEQALAATGIDEVIVSTDDAAIADIAHQAGARIIIRPEALSGDTAPSESAIAHVLEEMEAQGESVDRVVFLQATSPLRPEQGIAAALAHFEAGNFDSLLSLSPTHRFFWTIQDNQPTPAYDYRNRPRRQDLTPGDIRYVENGSLYIFTVKQFKQSGNRLGGRIGHIVFGEEYSMEIDTETDFRVLEEIAKSL